ncbi:PREDICTED: esterase E4-like [Papilio xuthus]|uniref:Carboxylic ester hydrolase n=1 Tax=Papilio xuthus TaxID=66420 RepID=A0AAJ7EA47_PAPXU|nr:PREDICTED: esterase E4-like [Papilio xuthus]
MSRCLLPCLLACLISSVWTADQGDGCQGSQAEQFPVVMTPSGPIRGSMMQTRRGRAFEAYRGIRYAEPPVGELRFQPPVPIMSYNEKVNATTEGPACPRPARQGYYLDEDCLRINVYTPSHTSGQRLPVVFYIHAGGFYVFSGRSDVAGPHYLLDRDIVLVTINYRLGSLGFLCTGDEVAPGNNGFKDQVAALRWVRRNIAAFGGDPDLVTITGCSAGSHSVFLHMLSPMSKGLFHRAISMSGSPIGSSLSPHHLKSLAVRQAQLLNCSTTSSTEIIDCLKTKSWRDIGYSLRGFYEFGFDPVRIWRPVVEKDFGQERFLVEQPLDAVRAGRMHPVPYIISQTRDEFFWMAFYPLRNDTLRSKFNNEWETVAPISFVLPRDNVSAQVTRLRQVYLGNRPLANDAESASRLGKLYADAIVGFPVHRLANLMCRHSPYPVYYYEFAYIGNHSHYEDPVTNKPTGAVHHDDLIYLFSLRYRFPDVPATGPDADLVDKMTAIWYTFAKTGDPNAYGGLDLPELSGLHWPAMTPDKRNYLEINKQLTVKTNLKEDRIKLWEELFPIEY